MGEETPMEISLSATSDPVGPNPDLQSEHPTIPSPVNPTEVADRAAVEPDGTASHDVEEAEVEDQQEAQGKQRELLVRPPLHLPQPEAPPGLIKSSSTSHVEDRPIARSASYRVPGVDVAALGKLLREHSSGFSAAVAKRFSSSFKDASSADNGDGVREFHLSGVKVIVRLKGENDAATAESDGAPLQIKGRVGFFSRSGCRDCGAVRSFLRDRELPFVEINLDVYPERGAELIRLAGGGHVPQIFLNEKLLGGLVALNSLRNSGEFERRVREVAGQRCPESAPAAPVYGFDYDEGAETEDAEVGVVRVLRQRLPIQDRFVRMKLVRNCFTGSETADAIVNHRGCGREEAVKIGKELARKHFIHHVFRENDFEDGNQYLYRFLEHDPAIPKCFNFRGSTNDNEPKSAAEVGHRLAKLMVAILEAYASDDRRHLDYNRISTSEEFRRYANLVQNLQRVDIFTLSEDQKIAFFLNLYNAMVIHAVLRNGQPGVIDRRAFFTDFQYIVGGYPYSLSTIRNGILRSNRRQPYFLIKPFSSGDKRLELAVQVNPLIHFGLCDGTQSSPTVRFFSSQGVEVELRHAAREFFLNGGIEVDLEKRTMYLTRIIKRYGADFGQDRDICKWVLNYLDSTKAGLLTHLLNDGAPISISYQNFDWSLNS